MALDPDRHQEPTTCPESSIVWPAWDKLAPLVLGAIRVLSRCDRAILILFGFAKLRARTKGAGISTVTLTLPAISLFASARSLIGAWKFPVTALTEFGLKHRKSRDILERKPSRRG